MPTYIAPRVHLNGDTKEELISQLTDAALALGDALTALRKAMPNARNYYVISESAFNRARTEHISRCARLQMLEAEITAIYSAVQNGAIETQEVQDYGH